MIDSVVTTGRTRQRSQTRPLQYGPSAVYPRSQPRPLVAPPDIRPNVPAVISSVPTLAPAPMPVSQPALLPQDVTPPARPAPPHAGSSAFYSHDIDEVYSRIASIEAEHPTAQAPAVVAAATAIPVATATVSQTPSQRLTARTPLKSRKKVIRRIRSAITTLLCMGILLVTGYISVDTWLTNQQVKEVVAQKQEAAVKGVALGEGDDETPVAPAVIENYQVAADLPRTLIVQKLGIKARVLPMGVNADGSMQAPVNINDSGWYNASAKPGTKGATVIDAHASGASRHGLFAYLDTLKAGDTLSIEKGDGQLLNYEVTATETVPMNDVDMRKVLTPQGTAEGMNLITCTGTWLPDQKTYNHRVIVYTKRT